MNGAFVGTNGRFAESFYGIPHERQRGSGPTVAPTGYGNYASLCALARAGAGFPNAE
ncbi:MAG: hypothetical protein ABIT20_06820 [Gemmatimonadaceae bacterium]